MIPGHSQEKSPIEASDYGGLQLDTRATRTTERDMDNLHIMNPVSTPVEFRDEKAFIAEAEARSSARTHTASHSIASTVDERELRHPLNAREVKIYGLRRRYFWMLFAMVLIIIILTAVVGGVVGALQHGTSTSNSSSSGGTTATSTTSSLASSAATPLATDSSSIAQAQAAVMVDSPLAMLAYSRNSSSRDDTGDEHSIRLFFQSAYGNIKVLGYDGVLAPWQNATPIFTDATNNTGLGVFTYLNGTEQTFAIYYIGVNGLLQEKRASISQTVFLPSKLNLLNLKAAKAIPVPTETLDREPQNSWDGYRMAVVYSTNFHDGPGARLFYHSLAADGTTWVQEMIWNQNSDVWSEGAMLTDPWPTSQLATAIDATGQTLRLFYSVGNLTLQESYLDISDGNSTYQTGVKIPNLLADDDAHLAVLIVNGDALVYHYSRQGTPSIRELNITGIPGSRSTPESYNLTREVIVAQPALIADGEIAPYQPIGAVLASPSAVDPSIYVSWAEQNRAPDSSYSALKVVSRKVSDIAWPNSTYGAGEGQVSLPLGIYNVEPSI